MCKDFMRFTRFFLSRSSLGREAEKWAEKWDVYMAERNNTKKRPEGRFLWMVYMGAINGFP